MRMLHDLGIDLLSEDPEQYAEIHHRIMYKVSGPPICAAPSTTEQVPQKLAKALQRLGIFLEAIGEPELLRRLLDEPDIEAIQNHQRGKAAQSNGAFGERQFKAWCVSQKHIFLKTKFLPVYLGKMPEWGDQGFWPQFSECAARASRQAMDAIRRYMRKHGFSPYGNIPGMADFFVVESGRRGREYFVEVKSGSGRVSVGQRAAIAYFEEMGFKTRIWNADAGVFMGETSNLALLRTRTGKENPNSARRRAGR